MIRKRTENITLKVDGKEVVINGSPQYLAVNYARAFRETDEGEDMPDLQETEKLLEQCRYDKNTYDFWFSYEGCVNESCLRGFSYWLPYGAGIAPKESQYHGRLIFSKVGKVVQSRNGRIKVFPNDKTAIALPEEILDDTYWIKEWRFDSRKEITVPKFETKGELWIWCHNRTVFDLKYHVDKSPPEFMPLVFGYDKSINYARYYYDIGWNSYKELEISAPTESPRIRLAKPNERFGVWKKRASQL